MMILSNYFIKKKIKALAKEASSRQSRYCSLEEANNILVVFNLKDKKEVLLCIEKLKEFNKEINICVYVPKLNREECDESWLQIKEDKLDSKGIPTNEMVRKFNEIPADILIDLTRTTNYPMHYLLLQHPSRFKVGNKSSLRDMYDMTVTMTDDDNIDELFEHLLFYLLTIRSK